MSKYLLLISSAKHPLSCIKYHLSYILYLISYIRLYACTVLNVCPVLYFFTGGGGRGEKWGLAIKWETQLETMLQFFEIKPDWIRSPTSRFYPLPIPTHTPAPENPSKGL